MGAAGRRRLTAMRVLLYANTDWYLFNFRRSLATALLDRADDVLLVSPPGEYGEKLVALGFRWIPAPMIRRSLNPLREMYLLFWLTRLIRRERINLVHGFTIKCSIYAGLAGKFTAISRVCSVTGLGYVFISADWVARVLRPLVRKFLNWALSGTNTRLILQNPDDVALCKRAGLANTGVIRLIPGSGVDCQRFVPDPECSRGERFRVLLPARLLWDKGLAEYVEAARRLRSQGYAIDFLLAGNPDPGNPAAVSVATVHGWVKEDVLQWLGHVEDMRALYRSVNVVVLPSYREGLPKGLIEAGACGLPLVTTDVPGCREVVTDGVDGLLVPVRDAGALASAISRLQSDPALAQRLGAAARQKVLALYDERIIIARTLNVYRELVCMAAG